MTRQSEVKAGVDEDRAIADAIVFFQQNWKSILISGLLGLVLSGIYGLTRPVQYEATLQIKMAQYYSNNNIFNIEQPAELIELLKVPTVYTDEVLRECGVAEGDADGSHMIGRFKATVLKGVNDAIEIKLRSNNVEDAKSCANALLKIISSLQQGMIEDLLKGKQIQLEQMQKAFVSEEKQLVRIRKSEGGIAYLTSLSALTFLRTGMERLNDEFIFAKLHPTKLLTPIYLPSRPASNKIPLIILLGIFAGLVMGAIFAALRNFYRKATEQK